MGLIQSTKAPKLKDQELSWWGWRLGDVTDTQYHADLSDVDDVGDTALHSFVNALLSRCKQQQAVHKSSAIRKKSFGIWKIK